MGEIAARRSSLLFPIDDVVFLLRPWPISFFCQLAPNWLRLLSRRRRALYSQNVSKDLATFYFFPRAVARLQSSLKGVAFCNTPIKHHKTLPNKNVRVWIHNRKKKGRDVSLCSQGKGTLGRFNWRKSKRDWYNHEKRQKMFVRINDPSSVTPHQGLHTVVDIHIIIVRQISTPICRDETVCRNTKVLSSLRYLSTGWTACFVFKL